jgi:hypothetical protein
MPTLAPYAHGPQPRSITVCPSAASLHAPSTSCTWFAMGLATALSAMTPLMRYSTTFAGVPG